MPAATSPEDKDVFINTYYVAVDKTGHSFLKQARTTKAELLPEQGGWVDINVWDLVSAWLKDPTTNLGFVLSVKTGSGVEIPVGVQHQQLPGNVSRKIRQNASRYPFYVAKFARPLCFHEFQEKFRALCPYYYMYNRATFLAQITQPFIIFFIDSIFAT
jgi:hypothetical protein